MEGSIEAVLFDVDGTLVDHHTAAVRALTNAVHELIPGVNAASLTDRWFALERQAMDRYLAGELTFVEQRRHRVRSLAGEFGLPIESDEKIDMWFDRYLRTYERSWRAYPDALSTLRHLDIDKHLSLGVITNGDSAQQHDKLQAVGLDQFFSLVVVSSDVGAAKPDPEIFRTACDALGVAPFRALYIGDDYATDTAAAAAAGLQSLWLNRSPDSPRAARHPQIHTLTDLISYLDSSVPNEHSGDQLAP
ncbi:HAD family hydrolase [Prescottella agglutinans]|uniref:Hydrolase of the HAD superfamily n=1 Tax=Prescottella agglutinans TaxID=1644129 RepID=A0ABT6MA01_9NOCA|nr:HAD family hydrolase [Prescottella agglutinans]MDH6281138.1 putative hydrolase of the HAD superfamily [Prescottella agglutinans]